MATAGDIEEVRQKTDETGSESVYDDTLIGSLIDTYDVTGAVAAMWDMKAARAAKLVDVTEAGASHKFSSQFDHAKAMSEIWNGRAGVVEVTGGGGVIRIKKIERS